MPRSKKGKKQKKVSSRQSAAGEPELSLKGFRSVMWPTVLPVKLRYSDLRAVVATVNQGVYVYRLNSVFDPDFTGVGGQPAGFDQLKTLYGRYRVMATAVRVTACPMTSGSSCLLAIAPSDNSALASTAEATADLRYAKSAQGQATGQRADCRAFYHIGRLLGYSDESMLANSNMDAAVTANPSFQQYLLINFETTGATDTVELSVELTYYVRMEVPTSVVDSVSTKRRFQHFRDVAALSLEGAKQPCVTTAGVVDPAPARSQLDGRLRCESGVCMPRSYPQQASESGVPRSGTIPYLAQPEVGTRALTEAEVDALRSLLPAARCEPSKPPL